MVRQVLFGAAILVFVATANADDDIATLRSQVAELAEQVRVLQRQLDALTSEQAPPSAPQDQAGTAQPVDLGVDEETAVRAPVTNHVLANPWWQNFGMGGFAAAGAYRTGSAGTRPEGGFEIKEASFFVTADIWNDAAFFLELQTNRLGRDNQAFVRTGEVYLHLRDLHVTEAFSFGLKLGRIDLPFGEEYLQQDAIDNPLITTSAAYPYGWDEGLLAYGSIGGLHWIAAVTDGTDDRSVEDDSEKAWNLKFHGKPLESVYLSLSAMKNGNAAESALEFGGSHVQPVGAEHVSTRGTSPSRSVDSLLAAIDAAYYFELSDAARGHLALTYGRAKIDDSIDVFDRDLTWFSIEPLLKWRQQWYVAARLSEIGTYDANKGYHFDGKTFAGGNAAFGYDVRRFRRVALGLGWTPNPRVKAKLEWGRDTFRLIDGSPFDPNNGNRHFAGVEVAAQF